MMSFIIHYVGWQAERGLGHLSEMAFTQQLSVIAARRGGIPAMLPLLFGSLPRLGSPGRSRSTVLRVAYLGSCPAQSAKNETVIGTSASTSAGRRARVSGAISEITAMLPSLIGFSAYLEQRRRRG